MPRKCTSFKESFGFIKKVSTVTISVISPQQKLRGLWNFRLKLIWYWAIKTKKSFGHTCVHSVWVVNLQACDKSAHTCACVCAPTHHGYENILICFNNLCYILEHVYCLYVIWRHVVCFFVKFGNLYGKGKI